MCVSRKGLSTALVGRSRYLEIDTYFNRWTIPLLQVHELAQISIAEHENLFTEDVPDRGETMDGEADGYDVSGELKDGHLIPYPHEYPPVLAQAILEVFKAEVLITLSCGSGQSLLGALMSGARGVGVVRNQAQHKFVLNNLVRWVSTRNLMQGFVPLPKPQEPWIAVNPKAFVVGSK